MQCRCDAQFSCESSFTYIHRKARAKWGNTGAIFSRFFGTKKQKTCWKIHVMFYKCTAAYCCRPALSDGRDGAGRARVGDTGLPKWWTLTASSLRYP